jgi:transcriptional regulator with XRE-family HTH domain
VKNNIVMEDRLLKLLDTEQLSSAKFADAIGVQRSSVSHILSGRNKPSFDFLQKTLKAFPMLNAEWLILGEGDMYEGVVGPVSGSLFDQPQGERISGVAGGAPTVNKGEQESTDISASEAPVSIREDQSLEKSDSPGGKTVSSGEAREVAAGQSDDSFSRRSLEETDFASVSKQKPEKTIVRVIVFYNDKTFESFEIAD